MKQDKVLGKVHQEKTKVRVSSKNTTKKKEIEVEGIKELKPSGYILKPFNLKKLKEKIKTILKS